MTVTDERPHRGVGQRPGNADPTPPESTDARDQWTGVLAVMNAPDAAGHIVYQPTPYDPITYPTPLKVYYVSTPGAPAAVAGTLTRTWAEPNGGEVEMMLKGAGGATGALATDLARGIRPYARLNFAAATMTAQTVALDSIGAGTTWAQHAPRVYGIGQPVYLYLRDVVRAEDWTLDSITLYRYGWPDDPRAYITPTAKPKLATPKGFKTFGPPDRDSFTLGWDDVPGADQYQCSITPTGQTALVYSADVYFENLKPNVEYTVTVVAQDSGGRFAPSDPGQSKVKTAK